MNERTRVALLLAVAMPVYGNTLLNSFTMDDELYILRNPTVTELSFRGLFVPTQFNNVFRPVTFSTFSLNWLLSGPRPTAYHLLNLLLHAAAALLLYLVLKRLLEALPEGTNIAWVAALLFVVHPLHSEAVASVAGRSELLAAAFLLGAWLLHLRDRPYLALLCLVLALMSKESAVVFLPLVLAADYGNGKLKPIWRYAAICAVTAFYLALLWKVQGGRFGEKGISFLDNPLASLPSNLRILNALRIAWKYVALHFYPATLSCDYSYNSIKLFAGWSHAALAAFGISIVLALWSFALVTRRSGWALAGSLYLIAFSVTANLLVPTGTIMAERLAYLPSTGFCLLVALLWVALEKRYKRLSWTMLALVLLVFAGRTFARNRDWKDNFTLYSAAVSAVPQSAKMHANLGGELLQRNQLEAAANEFQTALRIYPPYPEAMEFYGLVQSRLGQNQQARQTLEKSLTLIGKDNINYSFTAVNLAGVLMELGANDQALKLLDDVIATTPDYSRAWSNRAVIHLQSGDRSAARSDAEQALRLDPTNAQAQTLLNVLNAPSSAIARKQSPGV
jgi:protein O-mannosyl-transferase